MAGKFKWEIPFGIILILLSVAFYTAHYFLFHDSHHIWIYMVGDIAFVPIEVLMVSLVIHRLLSVHEKKAMMNKLNMVIGAYYSEMGNELISLLSRFSGAAPELGVCMAVKTEWSEADFMKAVKRIDALDIDIDCDHVSLAELRTFLAAKREFLLRIMENPNLLEHEGFTDVLWAVSHLAEELIARNLDSSMPEADLKHLKGDIDRAFSRLSSNWLLYVKHLHEAYPYLFSLAVRQNPFNPNASAAVTA